MPTSWIIKLYPALGRLDGGWRMGYLSQSVPVLRLPLMFNGTNKVEGHELTVTTTWESQENRRRTEHAEKGRIKC